MQETYKMKQTKHEKDNLEIYMRLCWFVVGGLVVGFIWSLMPTYSQFYDSGFTAGQNSTLHNATLMYGVANEININYLNQYNAIPIYVQSPFGQKIYQCSNISEVKQ
jgi:hypothetical protein